MSRNKIIIVVSIIVVAILGSIAVVLLNRPPSYTAPFSINWSNLPKNTVSNYDQIDITDRIGTYLIGGGVTTTNLTGTVRNDSYSQSKISGGSSITLLVDIPDAKRTYKVLVKNTSGVSSSYILCPSEDELKYGAFDCKDDSYAEDS